MGTQGYKSLLAKHGLRFSKREGNVRVAEKLYGDGMIKVIANTFPNGKLRSIEISIKDDGYWGAFMRREAVVIANAIARDKPEVTVNLVGCKI